jgi:BCD family chlorophyll transporter-like MFS transporter
VWGAVQATASGGAVALSGVLRDSINHLAAAGQFGATLAGPATGYNVVYNLEIVLLFATLVALGPLVRFVKREPCSPTQESSLLDLQFNHLSREFIR